MKKIFCLLMAAMLGVTTLVGCSSGNGTSEGSTGGDASSPSSAASVEETGMTGKITVISREDGSGTRGAFIELFGIEVKDANGNKVDQTTDAAEITNSTSVMLTTVAGNKNAIGYVSLGSLSKDMKALNIDGAEATVENIKSGEYKVSRPFNIVTGSDLSEVAQDFIKFIMSDEGQAVVEENKYISEGSEGAYTASNLSGKITVAGSSSVTPVME